LARLLQQLLIGGVQPVNRWATAHGEYLAVSFVLSGTSAFWPSQTLYPTAEHPLLKLTHFLPAKWQFMNLDWAVRHTEHRQRD
jgi:hypothetical protein